MSVRTPSGAPTANWFLRSKSRLPSLDTMRRLRSNLAIIAVAAAAMVPPALHAQAPTITEAGDPSVANDTIYKLAVDSAAYPQQATVLLLDDGVVRVEPDGRTITTYRQVTQILRERGVASHRDEEFGYDGD